MVKFKSFNNSAINGLDDERINGWLKKENINRKDIIKIRQSSSGSQVAISFIYESVE